MNITNLYLDCLPRHSFGTDLVSNIAFNAFETHVLQNEKVLYRNLLNLVDLHDNEVNPFNTIILTNIL